MLIKEVIDKHGSQNTPYALVTNRKPHIKHFRVFGCPVVFKRYLINEI